MLFLPKNRISIVRPDKSIVSLPEQDFELDPPYTFIRRCDGERFELETLLAAAIEQGEILGAYSNACARIPVKLVTGQLFKIDLVWLKRVWGIPPHLRAYTVELPTGIMGAHIDGNSIEHCFPKIHHIDENAISIGSNAFTNRSYTLETLVDVFFCCDDTEWKKALYHSLKEYSTRNYSPAILSLFTAFELLTKGLVQGQTKIDIRLTELSKDYPVDGFARLKKNFEKKVIGPFNALRHGNTPTGYLEIQSAYKAAFPILWWLEISGLI